MTEEENISVQIRNIRISIGLMISSLCLIPAILSFYVWYNLGDDGLLIIAGGCSLCSVLLFLIGFYAFSEYK